MKRKAVCFLLCLCFCFYSVSLNSFAGDEGPGYIFTQEDMFDLGFVLDEDGNFVYYGNDDPFDLGVDTLITKEKNYPDFDVYEDISWATFPSYIQDIIYMSLDGLNAVSGVDDSFRLPFVGVQVTNNGTAANVFVGVNVGLGFINNGYMSYSIFSYLSKSELSNQSVLYRLRVDLTNGDVVDWTKYTGEAFGTSGNLLRMLPWNTGNDSAVDDWYLYGANGVNFFHYIDEDGITSTKSSFTALYETDVNTSFVGFALSSSGFKSGKFLFHQDLGYPYTYFEYFEPPSRETLEQQLQQEQLEVSNSIWETVSSIFNAIMRIPQNIADAIKGFFTELGDRISGFFTKLVEDIKGLFIPSDGFFDTYQQEFQTYFKERFGLLYEIPELVISLLQKFVTFNPKDSDYSITFPEVPLPVLEDGEWREEVLIEEHEFSFDFINESPFNALYDAYVAFIWLVYILLLVNLIKNKANGVFKGG